MRFFTSFLLVVAFTTFSYAQLVITEIMYNPPEIGQDVYEFVEVYNNGSSAVNLLGYSFTEGIEYTFTSGFNLGAGEYVLFAVDSVAFEQAFGIAAFQITSGSLSNGGELVQLSDDMGNVVDEVDYDDSNGWPPAADGAGASLVLCDFNADNTDPANWDDAVTGTGVISGGVEIFANPNASSSCGSGAEVRFLSSSFEVAEDVGTVTISVEISNAASNTLSIDVEPNMMASTATIGADVMIMASTTLNFSTGDMVDTMDLSFTVVDDSEIEAIESLVLDLTNPSSGVFINGVGGSTEVLITDNDAMIADIVINEIMYSPPGTDSDYEYLELFNNDNVAVDLDGYYFSMGIVDTIQGVTLQPGDYLVIAVDSVIAEATYGVAALQWDSGALSNGGETIELRDALGNVVDAVTYDDQGDWPEEADGGGPALVLCDPSSDNADPASWIAGVQPTGIFISASEILGSPGAANDCTPPEPQGYTPYTIAEVTMINEFGVADSLGTRAELTGIVYGVNLRPGGSQFTIIDAAGDGIATFSDDNGFGYTVTEGDEVSLQGVVTQFNGLIQLRMDTIIQNSSGNPIIDPAPVTVLDENTESQLVQIEGVTITEAVTAGGGLNVTVTDGTNTYLMRVDFDTDITEDFITNLGANVLRISGIGGQFDTSEPFDDGYQLLPRYQTDIEIISSVVEPEWVAGLSIYPNPTSGQLKVEVPVDTEILTLRNYLGQTVRTWQVAGTNHLVDISELPQGMYRLEIIADGERVQRSIIKQ
ncbi:MAG: lamin tail domain-containing protein [Bacteroidota bacterium]